jgi:putative addiction module antidote
MLNVKKAATPDLNEAIGLLGGNGFAHDRVHNESRPAFLWSKWHLACYNGCGYTGSMVLELKLRKIGNSLGIVLPKEALAKLGAEEGESLLLTDANDDSLRLSTAKPEVSRQMQIAQGIMQRYRNTLRELAK